jgi:NIMA (never in mitosis gene a)-related kinase 1/4/5
MEFAAGGDLSTAIKRRAQQGMRYFSEDLIMLYFVQICLALWHVHTHNFMHRDLKSQNIFLCANNVAKLGDFGIARSFKHTQDMANTAVGTPYYLSPGGVSPHFLHILLCCQTFLCRLSLQYNARLS